MSPGLRQRVVRSAGGRPSLRPTWVEVDLAAIRHNVAALRAHVHPAEVIAVVKADGYGHGAVAVARAALEGGATWLGVALVEEGEELREGGVEAPVLLLAEPPPSGVPRLLTARLTPTVYSPDFLRALAGAPGGAGLRVHLKADTGMARLGVPPDSWDDLLGEAVASPLRVEGLWTHLACADQPGHPSVERQLDAFDRFLALAERHGVAHPLVHAASSAAALAFPRSRYGAVRAGIAVYGLPASPDTPAPLPLRPALRFVSAVAFTKRIRAGDPVSYGHTWRAPADGWIATVPVGYADGLPRALSNRMDAIVAGARRPLAGTVSMDNVLVWCGDDEVPLGTEVVLIGRSGELEVSAAEWAVAAGTVTYEVVTGIGARVPRVHVEGG